MSPIVQRHKYVLLLILASVAIISYFQGYEISTDRIFMCLIYCSLLITLYFTYSVIVAKKMLQRQLAIIVKDIKAFQLFFNIKSQRIEESDSQKQDNKSTIESNKQIWQKSLKIIGITLCLSFILSLGIWIYKNQNHKNYKINKYLKEIIFKNIIILFCVVLIQLFFSSVFVGHVLPLDTKTVNDVILNKILGN